MTKLLRNPEVQRTLLLQLAMSAVLGTVAFLWDWQFGLFTIGVCVLFVAIYLIATDRRYRRIAELTDEISRILHGVEQISLDRYSEGELGILQSVIYKMTVRLREQQQTLQRDKIYLADSIADISHQIRTPLTAINLLVSLISEPGIAEEKRKMLLHELTELLSRIEWLITALLKISKLDTGTVTFAKDRIALSELIDRAVAPILVPMDIRNQTLTLSGGGEVVCDPAWTVEAIGNIVKNCMEHTPENGTISVSASENALFSEIVITDTGTGIANEDLPHIFERFYKGKSSDEKSFGIGLALSRMIITAQNGTVKAENNPSNGAKFTVRFYKGTV